MPRKGEKVPFKKRKGRGRSTDGITPEAVAKFKAQRGSKTTKFKKGNSVWLQRSKHGRDAIFSTPELLWNTFEEYIAFCASNPWRKTEYKTIGKRLVKVEIPTAMPLSMIGFSVFCDVGEKYFPDFKLTDTYNNNIDFARVLNVIEARIKNQSLQGATVGTYNASIVARIHGLAENVNNNNINEDRKATADLFPKKLKTPKEGKK